MNGENYYMKSQNRIIHFGGQKLRISPAVEADYKYYHFEIAESISDRLVQFNRSLDRDFNKSEDIIIFSQDFMPYLNQITLEKLPSYQIFYEQLADVNDADVKILALKGAQAIDLQNHGQQFFQHIQDYYARKAQGMSLDNSVVDIASRYRANVVKKGSSEFMIDGNFGSDYVQILQWKQGFIWMGSLNVYPEIDLDNTGIDYFYRVYQQTDTGVKFWDIGPELHAKGGLIHDFGIYQEPLNFALFVKGVGRLRVGNIHVRRTLPDKDFLAIGGRRITEDRIGGRELGYYFNAGDLKPPLNVYFAGSRQAETFEGRWMMGGFGAPFILFVDPRLTNGAFYRGDGFEEKVIMTIEEKLTALGFDKTQLNIAGLSMGAYAALYYGARMQPHAILAGKPLANIGGLTINSRLTTPYGWDLAMNTVLLLKGKLTKENAQAIDQEFWDVFLSADFSKTTFAIAHMLNDTDLPFQTIFDHLKTAYPMTKLVHKGIEGRHNDDSPGITNWFTKQFRGILTSDFGRSFTKEIVEQEPLWEVEDE